MTQDQTGGSLAERLIVLFDSVRRPGDGRRHTNAEVAEFVTGRTGEPCSRQYVAQLRNGERDNPTKHVLEALAEFFTVPVAYFFDDELAGRMRAELELAAALRDNGVRQLALRATELDPADLGVLTDMIEAIRRRKGGRGDA
ncbi:helix-turn-helix domain-containing protein [Kutzneria viridogrisea]|uniref:HTH cro/C1-type domain-containing protein n=2 Tax=Kutzneria TaxID=43356 RepID=W5VZQ0_9PSEU|nr:helix-turn-helix transcriptional regulator [Kutzneria albida]AHH93751.1 hypothetical protein KALB_374 [Kutzneria albida DSM 43870]MBA8931245.1 transcriptional regulator with XRE-family HTH domain [Kutzneria viridogrisea]